MNCELMKVKDLINSLTDDEDLRQELWVHFLSGSAASTFLKQLEILRIYSRTVDDFQHGLEVFANTPISESAEHAIQVLSPIERQVVYLLVLGLTLTDVAQYKGISLVKVNQMIASIRSSQAWKDLKRSNTKCRLKKHSQKKSALV